MYLIFGKTAVLLGPVDESVYVGFLVLFVFQGLAFVNRFHSSRRKFVSQAGQKVTVPISLNIKKIKKLIIYISQLINTLT